jgi:two-component system chemotaxis response regulator CheB
MRVLVVDDSIVIRRLVADTLKENGAVVADMLPSGDEALRWIAANPNGCDVVVLDVEMPGISGFECVRELRRRNVSTPVVMFSTVTSTKSEVQTALEAGASACVHKPANVGSVLETKRALAAEMMPVLQRLVKAAPPTPRSASRIGGMGTPRPTITKVPAAPVVRARPNEPRVRPQALVIGSSTGGPDALANFFRTLPATVSVPIIIAQHMPVGFSNLLAERIARVSGREAVLAEEGMFITAQHVYLAPGGTHLSLTRSGASVRCHLSPLPDVGIHPSADVLFHSAADVWGPAVVAVVLTGMGSDGLDGALHIHRAGGVVFAQDEATSVVWGMPRAVAEAGIASVLPLSEIPEAIARTMRATPPPSIQKAAP